MGKNFKYSDRRVEVRSCQRQGNWNVNSPVLYVRSLFTRLFIFAAFSSFLILLNFLYHSSSFASFSAPSSPRFWLIVCSALHASRLFTSTSFAFPPYFCLILSAIFELFQWFVFRRLNKRKSLSSVSQTTSFRCFASSVDSNGFIRSSKLGRSILSLFVLFCITTII